MLCQLVDGEYISFVVAAICPHILVSHKEAKFCEKFILWEWRCANNWLIIPFLWPTPVASFPGLPSFCSSVCVQYNTQKWKSGEKRGRPGNIFHVTSVWWMRGGRRGSSAHLQPVWAVVPTQYWSFQYDLCHIIKIGRLVVMVCWSEHSQLKQGTVSLVFSNSIETW